MQKICMDAVNTVDLDFRQERKCEKLPGKFVRLFSVQICLGKVCSPAHFLR